MNQFENATDLAKFIVDRLNAQHPNSREEGASALAIDLSVVWIEGSFDLLKICKEILYAD